MRYGSCTGLGVDPAFSLESRLERVRMGKEEDDTTLTSKGSLREPNSDLRPQLYRNTRMSYVQFPERDKDFERKLNKDWQRPSLLKYNPREVPLEKKTIRPAEWIPDPGRSKTEMAKALREAWSLNVALHGRRKASYDSECQDFFHDTPIALTSGGLFPDHVSYVLDSGASIHLICKKHIDTANNTTN